MRSKEKEEEGVVEKDRTILLIFERTPDNPPPKKKEEKKPYPTPRNHQTYSENFKYHFPLQSWYLGMFDCTQRFSHWCMQMYCNYNPYVMRNK